MFRRFRVLACLAALSGPLLSGLAPAVAGDVFGAGRNAIPDVSGGGRSGSFDHSPAPRLVVGGGSYVSTERYRDGHRDGVRAYGTVVDARRGGDVGRRDRAFRVGRDAFRERDGRSFVAGRYDVDREGFDRGRRDGRGSFIRLRDAGRIDRFERDPRYDSRRDLQDRGYRGSRTLTTFDVGDWGWRGGNGSFVAYGGSSGASTFQGPVTVSGSEGPKIIDIDRERLDRRPIGPSGLDIVETGGAKIIRIAPGYRMASAKGAARAPVGSPALASQPWSSGWLDHCTRHHASFDPELGTYRATDGRVRFCNAD